MNNLLYLFKTLEDLVLYSEIIPQKYQSNFFNKVLHLPEKELSGVILILIDGVKENNLIKRKSYLKKLNEQNRFLGNIIIENKI